MLDKSKVQEFFDYTEYDATISLIGCGSVGSAVAEQLARMGFSNIHLYDFDTVDAHNITNQTFNAEDIGKLKVDCCAQHMREINPDINLVTHDKGLQEPYITNGIIILAVDNIELRKTMVEANKYNPNVEGFMDFRMRLTDAQLYMADAKDPKQMENFLGSMDFTHDEALDSTPVSACGVQLSVIYTVKGIVSFGMANLVKFMQKSDYKKMLMVDMDTFRVLGF